jgi:dihydrofolate reductase
MRRVRYNVAASLDGFIADAEGRYDWIPPEPAIDFGALFARVAERQLVVFSRTLQPADHPEVTIVAADAAGAVAALRQAPGTGDVWLYGGSDLFATLLAAGQVDTVEVTVIPVLLGGGVPLLPATAGRVALRLVETRVFPSGQVSLHYARSATD